MEAADCYPSCVKWLEIVRLRHEDMQAVSMGSGTAVHRQSSSPKWASSPLLNGMIVELIAVEVLNYGIMNGRITSALCIAVSSQGWTWARASGVLLVSYVIVPGYCSWTGPLTICARRLRQNFSTSNSCSSVLYVFNISSNRIIFQLSIHMFKFIMQISTEKLCTKCKKPVLMQM